MINMRLRTNIRGVLRIVHDGDDDVVDVRYFATPELGLGPAPSICRSVFLRHNSFPGLEKILNHAVPHRLGSGR